MDYSDNYSQEAAAAAAASAAAAVAADAAAAARSTTEEFNVLPRHVWPKTASRGSDGVVSIAGVPLPDIARQYGTPVYVIDEEDFRSRCRAMAEAFGAPERVHYAAKAFLSRAVAGWVASEGLSLDVASRGELEIALAGGFPPNRIAAHGNNKSVQFLRRCVEVGVGVVVLDSDQEISRLERIAAELGVSQDVLVRVTPGIEAHTHEFIATAHDDQKFGFSLAAGDARRACIRVLSSNSLRLTGLHCHVGSQVFDAEGFSLAADRVLGLWGQILDECEQRQPGSRERLAEQFHTLDLGGGYGIPYLPYERPLNVGALARDLLARVEFHSGARDIATPTVTVEPGRAIAGPSTVTVYEVGTVKDVPVSARYSRRYLSIDGGMSDNIRPALYGAEYEVRVVGRFVEGRPTPTRVVGSHCETGDIVIANAPIPDDVSAGDYLATPATGAYCYVMSSRYNAFRRPAVVSVADGVVTPMLRRETIEDLLDLEITAAPDGTY